jgi:ADP-ribose pyrophosphatase YjhB (NUDIX family)
MPQAVSKRQYRMMMAILHGKSSGGGGSRGRPPKSVAAKYKDTKGVKDLPEQSGQDRGGDWNEHHHAKDKERVKSKRIERKKNKSKSKSKKDLKKSFEEFYKSKAVGVIVMDSNNRILMGSHSGGIATPGGHVDPSDMSEELAALRELKEETGLIGVNPHLVMRDNISGHDTSVYLVESYKGKLKSSDELKNLKWVEPHEIKWDSLRDCCVKPIEKIVGEKLGKTLKGLMFAESLSKIAKKASKSIDVDKKNSVNLMGNGILRFLKSHLDDMNEEDFKKIKFDTHTISIRKHVDDTYSGRVEDGHKVVTTFTNMPLKQLAVTLMALFEWFSPEDEKIFDELDDSSLSDDAIEGGINELVNNYKKHNIGNIYQEMDTIREEIRNGVAVDVQQLEQRISKLFDKLENTIHTVVDKHNDLAQKAGKDLDELTEKLRQLQTKIDELDKQPEKVEAFSAKPGNPDKIHDDLYPYLPKPVIEISPNGKISISFGKEWSSLEKENFLKDLRAKAVKKEKK